MTIKTKREPIPSKVLQVLLIIGYEMNVTIDQMTGKTRQRNVVEARFMAYHILVHHIYRKNVTLSRVGAWFNRDHTCVIHALKNVDSYLSVYPDYEAKYNKLVKLTYGIGDNRKSSLTIDERVMRLPEADRASIMAYIENIEKLKEIE